MRDHRTNDPHECHVAACELVVACGDPTVMLDTVEEALDQISRAVRAAVVLPGRDTVGSRRDDCLGTGCLDTHDQGVGIVSFVGNQAINPAIK